MRIDDVAARLGVHRRAICNQLNRHGISFRDIRVALKIGAARRLLALSDMPIAEIALECGYSDQATFTKAFRRWTGITPRRFRISSRKEG